MKKVDKTIDVIGIGEAMVEFNQQADARYLLGTGGDTSNAIIAAARLGAKAAYLTHVGKDQFVVSDGKGGVTLFDWSNPKAIEKQRQISLPFRVSAPVAALGTGVKLRLVIADASNTLTLLEGDRLQVRRAGLVAVFYAQVTLGAVLQVQALGDRAQVGEVVVAQTPHVLNRGRRRPRFRCLGVLVREDRQVVSH